jgi:hypothetical protein
LDPLVREGRQRGADLVESEDGDSSGGDDDGGEEDGAEDDDMEEWSCSPPAVALLSAGPRALLFMVWVAVSSVQCLSCKSRRGS